ncbi:RNA polymerase factor sigma-54 [Burkholderia sp. WAC0059]|uniref:RNA polymerase factor sigma-54 n=1 Tax=Burkholderia sp. WAC0059 TaxID=2066022 RepID=UPI000C7EFD41|nr:RNA polymerase factor sigma-54 [Burkholderia sp. WAC0059]PLZ00318.1 RNA polymerase factor sigma-54 [Burkholderia sp. WAC0059]
MPTIALHARQHLALTPRLQQAVRLLQLSSLDFQQELREALDTNPFLEYVPPPAESGDGEPASVAGQAAASEPGATGTEAEGESGPADYPADSSDAVLPGMARETRYRDSSDSFGPEPADWLCAPPSLREHLHDALRFLPLDAFDREAAHIVVDALDDDGYLRQDLADLARLEGADGLLDEARLRVALRVVQTLDRPGLAARSLSECLALQLDALPGDTPQRDLAREIVLHHLEPLARREHGELQRRLGCDAQTLKAACALVRGLDPRPGNHYGRADDGYIVPDVIVRQVRNRWVVTVNPAVEPRARIHRLYVDLLARSDHARRSPLAQQLQEARWLIRNAHKRCETIQRVGECIVARQKAFFQYGEIALRPLLLRDIADELGMHESTVSRATGNKYMATPRGIFEFRRFFPRELETRTGGTCSAAAVRALIREFVDAEDPREPLSDVALAATLGQQGVKVARRTVTKYRQMMKVPAAELRRQR